MHVMRDVVEDGVAKFVAGGGGGQNGKIEQELPINKITLTSHYYYFC
jgi:hypothetical protein